jgi:hypothetical protein
MAPGETFRDGPKGESNTPGVFREPEQLHRIGERVLHGDVGGNGWPLVEGIIPSTHEIAVEHDQIRRQASIADYGYDVLASI